MELRGVRRGERCSPDHVEVLGGILKPNSWRNISFLLVLFKEVTNHAGEVLQELGELLAEAQGEERQQQAVVPVAEREEEEAEQRQPERPQPQPEELGVGNIRGMPLEPGPEEAGDVRRN